VTLDRRLAEVMTPFLTRVPPTLTLADAARLLACSFSGHLVVVGSDGGLLGIVSQEDLPTDASAL
jgi:CBS domain-containing protein